MIYMIHYLIEPLFLSILLFIGNICLVFTFSDIESSPIKLIN